MTETRTRPVSKTLLIVISLVVIAVVGVIVTGIHLSNPYLHKKVVEMLGQKFHADVELKDFHVYLFPGARIEGSGLVLRHEGRTDVPPLISIGEFSAEAGITGLLGKPWKIGQVKLKGLGYTSSTQRREEEAGLVESEGRPRPDRRDCGGRR